MTITVVMAFCPRCRVKMELEPVDVSDGGVNWESTCVECNAAGKIDAQELLYLLRTEKADGFSPGVVKKMLS